MLNISHYKSHIPSLIGTGLYCTTGGGHFLAASGGLKMPESTHTQLITGYLYAALLPTFYRISTVIKPNMDSTQKAIIIATAIFVE